jgi:hypothetical protein
MSALPSSVRAVTSGDLTGARNRSASLTYVPIPVTIEKAFVAILIRVFRVQPPRLQTTIIRESIHFESYVRE